MKWKAIATLPQDGVNFRQIYLISESGELWCYKPQTDSWMEINFPATPTAKQDGGKS